MSTTEEYYGLDLTPVIRNAFSVHTYLYAKYGTYSFVHKVCAPTFGKLLTGGDGRPTLPQVFTARE